MSASRRPVLFAALATLGLASAARAGTYITVATEGQTTIPNDGGDKFGSFSNDPGIANDGPDNGSDVVFTGADAVTGDNGIFDYNVASNSLTSLVLSGQTQSGDGSAFTSVGFPSVSNGLVSFNGFTGNNPSVGGIFTVSSTGTGLATLASPSVVVPGSSPSTFGVISDQSGVSGSTVLLGGSASGTESLFTSTYTGTSPGTLTKLTSGGGSLQFSSLTGSTVAYESSSGSISTINSNGTNNVTIVNTSSAAPGIGGTFANFNPQPPVADGSHVVFEASNNGSQAGLFLYPVGGGAGTAIVTSTTQAPGQANGIYLVPSSTSTGYQISNGIVFFNAETSNGGSYGIYSYNVSTGAYSAVVTPGMTYSTSPALTFTYASLVGEGINNGVDEVAFEGELSNSQISIFVDPIAVPEPCAIVLLGASSPLILRRRRSASA